MERSVHEPSKRLLSDVRVNRGLRLPVCAGHDIQKILEAERTITRLGLIGKMPAFSQTEPVSAEVGPDPF
jgi:hypothetical protein